MERVVLIHWKPEEATPRLEALRAAGFDVVLAPHPATPEWKQLVAAPPAVFVVDFDRLPSHSREVVGLLRQRKSTRTVPLVFAGGVPEKVARASQLAPDAVCCEWKRIAPAVRKALRTPVIDPPKPPPLGGSTAPLPKKLGIVANSVVAILGAPPRFDRLLEPLPEGVRIEEGARGEPAGVVLLVAATGLDLVRRFDAATARVATPGKFWVVWPKRASGVETDLTMTFLRAFAIDAGWVDYKVCSLDATWSGMAFARKRK